MKPTRSVFATVRRFVALMTLRGNKAVGQGADGRREGCHATQCLWCFWPTESEWRKQLRRVALFISVFQVGRAAAVATTRHTTPSSESMEVGFSDMPLAQPGMHCTGCDPFASRRCPASFPRTSLTTRPSAHHRMPFQLRATATHHPCRSLRQTLMHYLCSAREPHSPRVSAVRCI